MVGPDPLGVRRADDRVRRPSLGRDRRHHLGRRIGYLVRKHGLTIDDLLAAELVTADGQLLHVDDQSHPDLFWVICGGGGNFGVATRLQFRLHEVATIVGGLLLPATPM